MLARMSCMQKIVQSPNCRGPQKSVKPWPVESCTRCDPTCPELTVSLGVASFPPSLFSQHTLPAYSDLFEKSLPSPNFWLSHGECFRPKCLGSLWNAIKTRALWSWWAGGGDQGGITCGAIDEPRKSSKAIDERVIINFRDKNVVIARFRDKNVVIAQ